MELKLGYLHFYTHEIRELERYGTLGLSDGAVPNNPSIASAIWNSTHTATLEDYKLKDDITQLYTPDALKAADEQEWREYK
ncbi:MAG: pyocin [Rouxiella badensis]|uniref:Pyocin n=1 Tax=Rouxiella badensis TaxID=1646377 RepID=A0A1X0WG47_9GAMM|nr:hypothetical protein [Rouxiella badensis]ORJ25711.1 pyocin [Rouxiella badensis]WAT03406.1 pyocin [Rouxiella badensis]